MWSGWSLVATYNEAYHVLGAYAKEHSDGGIRVSCEAISRLIPMKTPEVTWRQLADKLLADGVLFDIPAGKGIRHLCTMKDCWQAP